MNVHAEIGGHVSYNMAAIANILKNLKFAGLVGDQ
jgi:kynureninase